jgi:hypothetical protein
MDGIGEQIEIMDCTSRGSGHIIDFGNHLSHKGCPECLEQTCKRKIGLWKYYNKYGRIQMEGYYTVLDYIGVPSVKDGTWYVYHESGELFQQILFTKGKVQEILFYNEEGMLLE